MIGRAETAKRNLNWVWAVTVAFFLVVIILSGLFLFRPSSTPIVNLPSPGEGGGVIPPVVETPTPTLTPTPEPELVFFDLGLFIWETSEGDGFVYCIGCKAPEGPSIPPEYGFPLYIERCINAQGCTIISSIPDPGIDEPGDKWNSGIIRDPDYGQFTLKIELTRTTERVRGIYYYEIDAYLSPDAGQHWMHFRIDER